MVRRFTAVVFFLCIVLTANAQQWKLKRIEGILGIGTTNVYSDLGGNPNASSILFISGYYLSKHKAIHIRRTSLSY